MDMANRPVPQANHLNRERAHTQIVIVGAGMAGLGAALNLTEKGYEDFLVLEISDRPGGRAKTIYVDNKAIDLGAQFVHDKNNALYDLAKSHNLLSDTMAWCSTGIFLRSDKVVFDESLVKQVGNEVRRTLTECRKFFGQDEFPMSVGDYLETKFNEYLRSSDDEADLRDMKLQLFDFYVRVAKLNTGCCDLKELSAKFFGSYDCPDDHYNLKNGYNSLVELIMEKIPTKHFLFDTAVTKVDYNVCPITVELGNGIITCDHIILTPSLGVLKEFNIKPALPKYLDEIIKIMGFHAVGKIFLFFTTKWWGETKGFQFLWKPEDKLNCAEQWIRHLTGFNTVPNHPTALLGWVIGEGVAQMERLTEEDVGEVCVKMLRRFLTNYNIPSPARVIRTRWLSDPWTKGTYSYITSKCDHSEFGITKLREPVFVDGVPKILLAGEAVHPTHYSTTHGAFESGREQSEVLYNYITKHK